jgi:hypothetical protein
LTFLRPGALRFELSRQQILRRATQPARKTNTLTLSSFLTVPGAELAPLCEHCIIRKHIKHTASPLSSSMNKRSFFYRIHN